VHAKREFWHLRGLFNVLEEQEVIGREKREELFPAINEKSLFSLSCQRIAKINLNHNFV